MEVSESSIWEGALRTSYLITILEQQTKKQYHDLGLFEDSKIKGLKKLDSGKDVDKRILRSNCCTVSLSLDLF